MEALEALSLILKEKLRGAGDWEQRGYPVEIAVSVATYPYCSWFWSGGGNELQAVHLHTERLQMSVKGVCGEQDGIASPYETALRMQGQISAELSASGSQDAGSNSLPSNPNWEVLTVTQGRMIYQRVQTGDTAWSYHAGHVYEFLMEEK